MPLLFSIIAAFAYNFYAHPFNHDIASLLGYTWDAFHKRDTFVVARWFACGHLQLYIYATGTYFRMGYLKSYRSSTK